jgi:hypothetical protein
MDDIVAEGREAWKRIGVATSFEAWLTVAKAVAIGRQHAMREAGANSQHGSKYRVAINNWLEANGFREMPYGIRKACCAMVDNLQAIEAWLASLPEKERASRRHPEVVVRNWRRATRPASVPKRRRCAAKLMTDLDAREARLRQIVHVFEGRVIERSGATATIEIPAQAGPGLGGLCGMAGFLPIFKEQQFRVGDGAFYRYSVDLRPPRRQGRDPAACGGHRGDTVDKAAIAITTVPAAGKMPAFR